MANIRVIGTQTGNDVVVHDTDVGLLGGISTASGSLTIAGAGNLAFTINSSGNITFDSLVISNIVFDNLTHNIQNSTTSATANGAGLLLLSGAGGNASGSTAGGAGGTTLVLSGMGGLAEGGSGAGGNGGDINIAAATGGTGTATGIAGAGGNIGVLAGNAGTNGGAGGNNGGNIFMDAGSATGAATSGSIAIGTAQAVGVTIGNATIPVTANGIWTFSNTTARVTSPVTNSTTTFSNISDLTLTLGVGQYVGRMVIKCNNTVAGEGVKFDFNGGTVLVSNFWAGVGVQTSSGTDTIGTAISTALNGVINYTTLTGETILVFEISMTVSAIGTFIARFAENSHSTGTITAELGSFIKLDSSPN